MRCAACAWLIDRALTREDGVQEVAANAITGRIRIVWDAARTPLSTLLTRLEALGYRPSLATGETRERERRRERALPPRPRGLHRARSDGRRGRAW